jgi:hypothetical protein
VPASSASDPEAFRALGHGVVDMLADVGQVVGEAIDDAVAERAEGFGIESGGGGHARS